MHFSCRDSDSVLTSPSFLRAQTESRTMLCFFSKPFTAHLLSHDAQQAFVTEEWWSFPNPGTMALQICRTLLRGYSPARFKVEVLVCNLGGRPCPYHGPAWTLIKFLNGVSAELQLWVAGFHPHTWTKGLVGEKPQELRLFPEQTWIIKANQACLLRGPDPTGWGPGDTVGAPGLCGLPGITTERGSTVASSGNFQRIQVAARTFFFYKQTVFYFLVDNYKHTCSNCGIFP